VTSRRVAVIGSGHLARRIRTLAAARGHEVVNVAGDEMHDSTDDRSSETIERVLRAVDVASVAVVYLVDEHDERNLAVLIALLSSARTFSIVVSLFNEHVAPHLRAAHPHIRVLNPARIAAPAFIAALDAPLTHTLRYVPAQIDEERGREGADLFLRWLVVGFLALVVGATSYFHVAESLSWLDALYFVVVTVATVGYGDIALARSPSPSKFVGIALILGSTFFIWMIFSLTVDRIIKRRVQLALGRKRYTHTGHVVLCGLGRLGHFVAEGLLRRGERVLIVERDESSTAVDHFRAMGADVYVGDARLPRVLADVGVRRAKALYSLIDDDYVNLEIGLNARSFAPDLRLILRIFDEPTSLRLKEHLDIHLTYSMTAIADEQFVDAAGVAAPAPVS
jgi:Trk K+ transport system NAD-binding subunit